ncbi:PEP/pyruvate-binding domain-containing protein [Desulfosediminicola flagellatus]|uniref:PEP/pyruvate-binding domain-containing protein n=1 Tax=Desulfosediminicola flagellatus TaxID=2569541 RepID=UPI0010AC8EC9|nr:PEP/pyruvate-binding domain-containing protein [Desulfosediminicola flagellatus]
MLNILKQFSEQLLSPDQLIRKRYRTFKELLASDRKCHELLAELEDIHYNGRAVDINRLRMLFGDFSACVAAMISCLQTLAPGQFRNLTDYHKKFDFYARFALSPPKTESGKPWILPINASYQDDRFTGGKGLHLSQLFNELSFPVPAGFIVSTSAWNSFVEQNTLRPFINSELARININSLASLQEVSQQVTDAIKQAPISPEIADVFGTAIEGLISATGATRFAVRSSAIGEDSSLSFAGQYRSLLQVTANEVQSAWRKVVASKYSPEALLYRIMNGLDDEATPMATLVLNMVDARVSGVITTGNDDTEGNSSSCIHLVPGLGDRFMGGQMVSTTINILNSGQNSSVIDRSDGNELILLDRDALQLSHWAEQVARYYGTSQEIEWCQDASGSIYLLQTRRRNTACDTTEPSLQIDIDLPCLFQGGENASPGIATGPAFHLRSAEDLPRIPTGAILFCDVTPPSLVSVLPKIGGVIAALGSVADHFSSVAREFRVPVLVKTGSHKIEVNNGDPLTLWSDTCSVYLGKTESTNRLKTTRQLNETSPVARALKMVVEFSSPLELTDASADNFQEQGCRSMHDIIRFAHEQSVQAMFQRNPDSYFRKPSSSRLVSDIPLEVFIIDVGDTPAKEKAIPREVRITDINSLPFHALWQGLTHQNVNWQDRSHFDWKSYDSIALAGGIATKNDSSFASYCLLSPEYLNINMRFGYHFALLDCLCTDSPEENYILLRFAGGGGTGRGKDLRLSFITRVLVKLNFDCEQTAELLDARYMRYDKDNTANRLDQVGRLLGATRLLDMVLKDETEIDSLVKAFFQETYDYSNG